MTRVTRTATQRSSRFYGQSFPNVRVEPFISQSSIALLRNLLSSRCIDWGHERRRSEGTGWKELNPEGLDARGGVGAKKRRKKGNSSSKGPNWVHSLDGHDKLMGYECSTFRLAIYRCIDTASRKIMWLRIWTTNSDLKVIGRWYLEYLMETGTMPNMIRVDKEYSNHGCHACLSMTEPWGYCRSNWHSFVRPINIKSNKDAVLLLLWSSSSLVVPSVSIHDHVTLGILIRNSLTPFDPSWRYNKICMAWEAMISSFQCHSLPTSDPSNKARILRRQHYRAVHVSTYHTVGEKISSDQRKSNVM